MLQVVNLSKSFGVQSIFEDVSFSMVRGQRLGILGRNGSGKSTLFRLILGEEHPDEGQITMPRDYRCGHLAQHLNFHEDSILKEACRGIPDFEEGQEYKAEIILSGLGFSDEQMLLPPSSFSGGFQIRVELARVLLSEPNLLLLDEPTNYLDIVSLRWLERFLRSWKNELMIISHDREFMDSVCTHSMLLRRRKVRIIEGHTAKLLEQARVDDQVYEKTRLNQEAKKKELEVFISRFRAQAAKATLVQSKVKAIERMGTMEEIEGETLLDFNFRNIPFPGKVMTEIKDLHFHYPATEGEASADFLIRDLNFEIKKGDRIGVIGKNGRGKSTLLKLLAGELSPVQGSIKHSPNEACGYFGQTNIQRLAPQLTVEEEIFDANQSLSRTAVRSICGTMMFGGDDALKKVSVLSGGEKSRVLLGRLLARPCNLLLLDEPSNHLDVESVEAMIESLRAFEGALIVVTHNERILRAIADKLIVFQAEGPQIFDGGYDYFLEKIGWEEEASEKPTRCATKAQKRNATSQPRPQQDRRTRVAAG